jgi:hypothetical protein
MDYPRLAKFLSALAREPFRAGYPLLTKDIQIDWRELMFD